VVKAVDSSPTVHQHTQVRTLHLVYKFIYFKNAHFKNAHFKNINLIINIFIIIYIMTEVLHNATRKIIEDPIFLKIIEIKLNSIMEDGKIDKKDIPDIMILVLYCTNNLKKFNLTYNELSEVLEETLLYLLNHFKVIPEEQKYDFTLMTKTMVNLVMFKPKIKSCLFSCWNKLLCK
jgi:hypothetical protein